MTEKMYTNNDQLDEPMSFIEVTYKDVSGVTGAEMSQRRVYQQKPNLV